MKVNPFLTNEALKKFIEQLKISEGKKQALIAGIPYLDEKERQELLLTLTNIYLLQLEEEEVVKKIREYFEK